MTGLVRRVSTNRTLRARALVAGWGRSTGLRGVSLELRPGERVALLGPNGSGKTTLFDVLAGRLRPRAGELTFRSKSALGLEPYELARRGLAYVTQDPAIFPDLSVREHLRIALRAPAAPPSMKSSEAEQLASALKQWGLSALAERPAGLLSGGERRRLEVATALMLKPRLLLLDEPFAGLDPGGRCRLSQGLAGLPQSMAVVLSDHATVDVLDYCERVLLLLDGQIVYDGPRADFTPKLPAARRYFAGTSA